MDSPKRCAVIVVGAGMSGISAAKVLAAKGVEDILILEAADQIGGRIRKEGFGGVSVELGAGWIAGVGGGESNPVWELAHESGLRTCFSDYSKARFNIYDRSGKIFPHGVAADSYKKAVDEAIYKLRTDEAESRSVTHNLLIDTSFINDKYDKLVNQQSELPSCPKKPIELAIDFLLHDFEMAEVEPISTFVDFGEKEFLVADERGYEYLLYKIAKEFLFTSKNGKIVDNRLKLNTVVREIQHSRNSVVVKTEGGCIYEADYVILSASIGVLQSDLISFSPPLPRWKTEAINNCDVIVYTKVFLKFPYKFWPCGSEKEFFIYAHERRGYYTFWQNMENVYPGSNILVVTLTNGESKRVESQSDQDTLREAMEVLRDMFGPNVPDATDILVPRWWNNRFQRGSYSNYPFYGNSEMIHDIKAPVGRVFFTGEHTSERFSGYVHGAYLAGIDTAEALLEDIKNWEDTKSESQYFLLESLLSLSKSPTEVASGLHVCKIPNQSFISRIERGLPEIIL